MVKLIGELIDKRTLLSSFFITLLIGLAYREMILVVKNSFQTIGFAPKSLLLIGTFFFITTRFFIGNQLHLISDKFVKLPGLLWLYDIMVIIVQSVVLILLAGFSSIDANQKTTIGFLEIMILLYTIDIVWIISQEVMGVMNPKFKREVVYWGWAIINLVLSVIVIILSYYIKDLYSTTGLYFLFFLNLFAFIVDVFLLDYEKIILLSEK